LGFEIGIHRLNLWAAHRNSGEASQPTICLNLCQPENVFFSLFDDLFLLFLLLITFGQIYGHGERKLVCRVEE